MAWLNALLVTSIVLRMDDDSTVRVAVDPCLGTFALFLWLSSMWR